MNILKSVTYFTFIIIETQVYLNSNLTVWSYRGGQHIDNYK